jgi:hypothetical protein
LWQSWPRPCPAGGGQFWPLHSAAAAALAMGDAEGQGPVARVNPARMMTSRMSSLQAKPRRNVTGLPLM